MTNKNMKSDRKINIPGTEPPNQQREEMKEATQAIKDILADWENYAIYLYFQAKSTKEFYDALLEQGFSEKQALEIVKNRSN